MYSDLKERVVPLLREIDSTQFGAGKKILDIIDEYEQKFKGCICWSIDDMIQEAREEGWELSEDDAQAALEEMIDDHDANNGINWNTVSYYINKYK